jgi:hypothetical protein
MSYSITSNKLIESVNKLESLEQKLKELLLVAEQHKTINSISLNTLNDVISIIIRAKVELLMSKSLVTNVDFRTNKQKDVINNMNKIISQVPDKTQFTKLINDLNNITSDLRSDFNLDIQPAKTNSGNILSGIKIDDNHFLLKSGSIINQNALNTPVPKETKSIMGNMTRNAIMDKRFGGLIGGKINKTRRIRK